MKKLTLVATLLASTASMPALAADEGGISAGDINIEAIVDGPITNIINGDDNRMATYVGSVVGNVEAGDINIYAEVDGAITNVINGDGNTSIIGVGFVGQVPN